MRILGVTASGFVDVSDYELISSTILGSSTPSVTFSSLGDYASTYKHLQLRTLTRNDNATNDRELYIRFNGDTTSSYASHRLTGNGSTVTNGSDISKTSIELRQGVIGANQTANIFGAAVIDILDFSSTSKNTTIRSLMGHHGSANRIVHLYSGFFNNTAAITSINLRTLDGVNFVAGSRFSLYGIKG
jgi:hypothetical protein